MKIYINTTEELYSYTQYILIPLLQAEFKYVSIFLNRNEKKTYATNYRLNNLRKSNLMLYIGQDESLNRDLQYANNQEIIHFNIRKIIQNRLKKLKDFFQMHNFKKEQERYLGVKL